MQNYSDYILCIQCSSGELENQEVFFVCRKCGRKYEVIEERIVRMMPAVTADVELSVKKWEEMYGEELANGSYKKEYDLYAERHLNDILRQLKETVDYTHKVYLEIGCGPFFLGQNLAKDCALIIGIDFCLSSLKIAKKMMMEKGIDNYILIQGDILSMPLQSEKVDFIYGGGVIEHFKDTDKCVEELFRVLKKDGISFNTVPYLNIGSLTYRQVWGNIPNVPFLRPIFEFIHIKLLRGRHMIFGYEMSFLGSTLKNIHQKVGFKGVKVEKFDVKMSFDFIPNFLRKPFVWLANNSRLFWPMVKVIGKK